MVVQLTIGIVDQSLAAAELRLDGTIDRWHLIILLTNMSGYIFVELDQDFDTALQYRVQ